MDAERANRIARKGEMRTQSLRTRLSVVLHQRDAVRLTYPVFRNDEFRMTSLEDRSRVFQPGRTSFATTSRGGTHLSPQSETGQKLVTVLVTIGGSEVFRDIAA